MKVFLAYLVGMFLFGFFSRPLRRSDRIVVLGTCVAVCIAYFFLNQI